MARLRTFILLSMSFVLGTDATEKNESKKTTCGTLYFNTSDCRSKGIIRFVPGQRYNVTNVRWAIYIKNDATDWSLVNETMYFESNNASGFYLTLTLEQGGGYSLDILLSFKSYPLCQNYYSENFRVKFEHYNDHKNCTCDGDTTGKCTQKENHTYPQVVPREDERKRDGTTKREQYMTGSGQPSTDKPLKRDKHSPDKGDAEGSNTDQGNGSFELIVVLALTGLTLLAIVIATVILVYRKKKGNTQNDANVTNRFHSVTRVDEDTTPEVTYAQIYKARKTVKSTVLVTQNEQEKMTLNVTPRAIAPAQPSKADNARTAEQTTETGRSAITATIPQSVEGELVYIQLDTDHLKKPGTLRPLAGKANNSADEQDSVEYVGIDFAKSTHASTE